MEFSYLAERVAHAPTVVEPFPHIYVRDMFSDEHLHRIVNNPQVHFGPTRTNVGLISRLLRKGYRPEEFPGCTRNIPAYLWRLRRGTWPTLEDPVEGQGMMLRLTRVRDPWLASLIEYLNGPEFVAAIEHRFGLTGPSKVETAIQKYLSGYEISPHPDIRRKRATYMINVNDPRYEYPDDLHTHLLKFRPEREWVYDVWRERIEVERCWVPWDWCETQVMTVHQNAMVMFSPTNETLHAVKLRYGHRSFQRTQVYGNLFEVGAARLESFDYRMLDAMPARR